MLHSVEVEKLSRLDVIGRHTHRARLYYHYGGRKAGLLMSRLGTSRANALASLSALIEQSDDANKALMLAAVELLQRGNESRILESAASGTAPRRGVLEGAK